MSDSSDKKTKEQLLAELEELKRKLEQHDEAESSEPAHARAGDVKPDEPPADPSRRDALKKMWVAPVVLSLPMAQVAAGLGAILTPNKALAYGYFGDDQPVHLPTMAPTHAPTRAPTAAPRAPTRAPTAAPTRAPTAAPTQAPTPAPTAQPTMAGHCVPAPTMAPTVSPVLGMASAPDCGPSPVGCIALGAARATVRVRLRGTDS